MAMNRAPSNKLELKSDAGVGGNPTTPIQEDKNGQAVINSGAGTAHKQNKSSDLHMIDAAGNKQLAKIGKGRFEIVKDESVSDTVVTTNPPGDTKSGGTPTVQTETPQETTVQTADETVKDSGIGTMLGQSNGEGLTHSWDKEAKQYADKLYQQGKAEAESEYSVKASELKTEAQNSQEELEMQKYTNAQTADKLGWTGGYVLDQQRQLSVLKAGIQAQLFNTQELNRLGLESSLAAARLNADLKNQELAHQYYQDAITNAINTANVTGYYLSPEASDYLTQQRAAEQIMATSDPNSAEYAQAQNVYNFVENYFSGENGLTKQGTKTLALMSHELQQYQFELDKKQVEISYIMASKQSTEYTEGKAGLYYDESGNTAFAGTSENDPIGSGPDLVNFSSLTSDKLVEICNKNSLNSSFFEQCIKYKLDEVYKLYDNFLKTQELEPSIENWNEFANGNGKAVVENYTKLLSEVNNINSFDYKEILNTCGIDYGELFIGADFKIKDIDGNTVDATNGTNTKPTVDNNTNNNSGNSSSNIEGNIILNKNYDTAEEAAKALIKSDDFKGLLNTLEDMDLTSSPADWYHDPGHSGGKALTWFPWIDNIGTADYKDLKNDLKTTKQKILESIGEENCALILEYANTYNNMSERDRNLLSDKEKEIYEQVASFNTKMSQIDTMINYYEKHDANVFTNPWESIGETWTNYGNNWANTKNILDVVTNIADTAGAIVETVGDAVYGALKWITGDWFGLAD